MLPVSRRGAAMCKLRWIARLGAAGLMFLPALATAADRRDLSGEYVMAGKGVGENEFPLCGHLHAQGRPRAAARRARGGGGGAHGGARARPGSKAGPPSAASRATAWPQAHVAAAQSYARQRAATAAHHATQRAGATKRGRAAGHATRRREASGAEAAGRATAQRGAARSSSSAARQRRAPEARHGRGKPARHERRRQTPPATPEGRTVRAHAKALHGNPSTGTRSAPWSPTWRSSPAWRPSHPCRQRVPRPQPPAPAQGRISGQVRRVTASIRREMKRRAAVEPSSATSRPSTAWTATISKAASATASTPS